MVARPRQLSNISKIGISINYGSCQNSSHCHSMERLICVVNWFWTVSILILFHVFRHRMHKLILLRPSLDCVLINPDSHLRVLIVHAEWMYDTCKRYWADTILVQIISVKSRFSCETIYTWAVRLSTFIVLHKLLLICLRQDYSMVMFSINVNAVASASIFRPFSIWSIFHFKEYDNYV